MNEKIQIIFGLLGGLAIFIFGMNMMSECLQKAAGEKMKSILAMLTRNPVMGVLAGALTTAVLQSSSATTVMAIGFVSAGLMTLPQAISIILGANIGTTITALLACIGQSRDAKRTALAHCTFNISGCLIFIWLIKPFAYVIQMISPKGPEIEVISRQIANAHTAFNITMTIIWVPFIWLLVKIVTRIIPDGKTPVQNAAEPRFLDWKLMNQPAAALQMVAREVMRCSDMVQEVLDKLAKYAQSEDETQLDQILEQTGMVQKLDARINEYLVDLFSAGVLTEEQATQTAGLMCVLSDVSRIGSLSTDLAQTLGGKTEKQYQYSEDFTRDIENSLRMIETMYTDVLESLKSNDPQYANRVRAERGVVLGLDINMRKAHMDRVSKGECSASLTAPFNDVMHCINRMGNSCLNIADAVSSEVNIEYFIHEKEPVKV